MKPPRILFVYQFLTLGGVEVVMQTRLRELARRDIEARVLFLESYGGESLFEKLGDQIVMLTQKADIERYLRDFNPDWISIIDTPAIIPIASRVVPNTRIAYEVHTPYPASYAVLLDPDLFDGVSGIIVPSQSQKEFIALRTARPLPIRVVANSIPEEFFRQRPLPYSPKRPIIMWVGRLDSLKNWRGFITLAAQVRERADVEFLFVGGLRSNRLEQEGLFKAVKHAGLMDSFRWLPIVNYEDMPRLYDVVRQSGGCLVSTSWAESFGMAALEAMASRCPVIAPDIVGLRDLVKHEQTGWLYPSMNLALAGDFILESLQNLSARQMIIENAERLAKDFTPAATIDQLLAVFSEWSASVTPTSEPLSLERRRVMEQLREKAQGQAAQLAEKELLIESLSEQCLEKEQAVDKYSAQLVELEQTSQSLEAQWVEQERLLATQIAEKEQEVQSLLSELAEKREEIEALSSQAEQTEQNARSLSLQLARKEQSIEMLSEQLAVKDEELRKITNSPGWRLLSRYGQFKYRYLLPIYKALGLPPYHKKNVHRDQTIQPPFEPFPDEVQPLETSPERDNPATPQAIPEEVGWQGITESKAYDVVCFPIIDWDFRFQRPQQLMSRFAAAGHRVFYLSQNFYASGPAYKIEEKQENIFEVSLRGPERVVYRDVLDEAARDSFFDSLDALRRDLLLAATVAIVQLPFWWPLVKQARSKFAWPVVYDCMDYHAGFSTNEKSMIDEEHELLTSADLVVVSSNFLEEQARPHNANVLMVRNACDYEHFAKADQANNQRPVIGYYGAIADWFDSDLVADLAERRPDWDFLLVGSTFSADLSRLSKLANVSLPGEKPYAEIPDWLARFDVALIPFQRTPLTEATNPVKAYEILASGKPIVSVPIPEVAALVPLVRLASTAEEFEQKISAALAENDSELIEKRRAFASQHTWDKRYEMLAPAIREIFPKASIIIVTYNNLHLNRLCLESLYARMEWPNFEVIVIDNASADATPQYLLQAKETLPHFTVILNDENLGFAAANNIGLKQATGEYLVLLNNDTVLTRGWLAALIRHLHADREIGIIGPVTNEIGNEAKVEVGYRQLEEMPGWAANFVRANDSRLFAINVLAMFCVAMRSEVFAQIGLLDESFQIGMFEDDDYTRRVRENGYKVICTPDSFIHHAGGASFKLLNSAKYLDIFQKNRRVYEEKWGLWEPHMDRQARQWIPDLCNRMREIIKKSGVDANRIVIFVLSIGWGNAPFQRPHQLASELARQGFLVFFDCSGSRVDHLAGFVQIRKNLWTFNGPKGVLDTLESPILWTLPYNVRLTERWENPTIIYDWIDDLSVLPYKQSWLQENHERMLKSADLVLCVERNLLDQAREKRPDALYVQNGVEYARFSSPASTIDLDFRFTEMVEEGRPIAGYYGAIGNWLDVDMLAEVAGLRTDWSFVIIGQKLADAPSLKALEEKPNVLILQGQNDESLPNYLAQFTVATIPFKVNRITKSTSPLNLYEYFAGGKPVISTPLPECQSYEEVRIVRDVQEFSQGLDAARESSRDPKLKERLRSLGRENSWAKRVQMVTEALSKRTKSDPAKPQPLSLDTSGLASSGDTETELDEALNKVNGVARKLG